MMRCVLYLVLITILLLLLQYHHVAAAAAVLTTCNATNNTTEMSCDHMQKKLALFQFKLSFSIDNAPQDCDMEYDSINDKLSWHPKTMNWSMDSDYCKWDGVTCNHTTGDVIGLDLSCRHLVGSINPNSTIFRLSHLQVIDFSDNDISGIIPEEIFHLPNLKELRISPGRRADNSNLKQVSSSLNFPKVRWGSNNTLQKLDLDGTFVGGVIPEEIFHLPKLEDLTLRGNSIVSLPKLKWGSSNTLQSLDLDGVTISGGALPDSILYLNSLTSLVLLDCNLSGPIPISTNNLTQLTHLNLRLNQLSGQIPDSLVNLKKLEELELGGNNLNGEFPSWVANLTQLQTLFLYGNSLTGSLPSYLPPHSLLQLQYLYLTYNSLSGTIPSWLFQLPSLIDLDISHNRFTGQLPYQFNSSSSSLKNLRLSGNSLNGSLPSYLPPHSLLRLYSLDLSYNSLNGTLPSWLFQLPSLTELHISDNEFTGQLPYKFNSSTSSPLEYFSCGNNLLNGTIPKSFSDQLVNLTQIYLSSNKFSGDLDLQTFSHLQHLQRLHLSHNSLSLRITTTTTLSLSLESLGLSSCKITKFPHFITYLESLGYLDLSNNQIDGNIPNWIGGLTGMSSMGMYYLNLSHNSLTGGVEHITWSSLQYLDLQSNMLNGSLSSSICNSTSLQILNLSHNNFSGVFPVCPGNLSYGLSVLDLRMNNINGSLPSALSKFRNLRTLNLNGNKLQGTIPPSFSVFDSLEVLDLGSNHIDGTFPHCLEALPKLQVLILKSNKFHGNINNISHIEHPFPGLRIIDLSDNQFSSTLPAKYIDNFKGMMNKEVNKVPLGYMGDRSYSDSIALVIKGRDMELVKILTVFTTIDLSRNMFEGEIPAHIGNLVSLRYLNLSRNHLRGSIPSSIGDLSVLESLDFSSNRLVGKIPQQLTHIDTLAKLNLSQNDLNGHIPEAPHFCTFDNNSYSGNSGLCGFPLSKRCMGDIVEPQEEDDEGDDYFFSGFSWEAVVIGYGCGVVMGFVGGYIMFMAGKPKWYVGIIARELGLKVKRIEIVRR